MRQKHANRRGPARKLQYSMAGFAPQMSENPRTRTLSIYIDSPVRPALPGCARLAGAIRARSEPLLPAPVVRMTLVGKAQTPSNYYYYYYYYYLSLIHI